ncbi:hypothetical protein V6N13_137497 [Hibiscus sabdariffa]|uniref:Uncharacterized protein n=1 Tax=Hibiscus sabdariffa TaxID=183260 RepID=A0ABR2DKG5_9ROSI
MDDYNRKRSGQIPAFGDWDYANELPITQYFECARQAGLVRVGKHTADVETKHSRNHAPVGKVSRVRVMRGRGPLVTEKKTAVGVCDVTELPRKHHVPVSNNINDKCSKQLGNDVVLPKRLPLTTPKPVDKDLYEIPPEILHSSKSKQGKAVKVLPCQLPLERENCSKFKQQRAFEKGNKHEAKVLSLTSRLG